MKFIEKIDMNDKCDAQNTRKLYVTVSNTNLTDGAGLPRPIAVSSSYSTAYRLGKGKSVQGSNCYVETVVAKYIEKEWMIPMSSVMIEVPTEQDIKDDEKMILINKVKDMGLTEKEINILVGKN